MGLVHELMAFGSWDVTLKANTPQSIRDALFSSSFGHVFFTNERVPKDIALETVSSYTGILLRRREIEQDDDTEPKQLGIGGPGLVFWLGNAQDRRGPAIASLDLNHTFANAVRALLPASVGEGTLYDPGGSNVVHSFRYSLAREALEYICTLKDAEYRINPNLTLDAGTAAQLYPTVAKPVLIVRRDAESGGDPDYRPVALTQAAVESSFEDYVTDSLLVAQGEGDAVATGSATLADIGQGPTPFKDFFGNLVQRTILAAESSTEGLLAPLRAKGILAKSTQERLALSLAADQYDLEADVRAGDYVEVYDPTTPTLIDLARQGRYRGEVIHPKRLRVMSTTAPYREGMGCYLRDGNGNVTDLSDYAIPEGGSVQIQVGDFRRSITSTPAEVPGPRVTGDASIPGIPVIGTILTAVYTDANGQQKAQLTIPWTTPLNVGGSTIVDGASYPFRWRRNGQTVYQQTAVIWGVNSITIQDLSPGVTYDVGVGAQDAATPPNFSGWSADVTVIAAPDTIAPSPPAPPTVDGNILSVLVTHSLGKASGGTYNLESDLAYLYVYGDVTANFTISAANRIGRIPATKANLDLFTKVIQSFPDFSALSKYFKVTAVDHAGNESPPSTEVQATPGLVPSAAIISLVADKIAAGTITASIEMIAATFTGGLYRSAPSGQRVEIAEASKDAVLFYTGNSAESAPGSIAAAVTGGASAPERTLYQYCTSPGIAGTIIRAEVGMYSRQADLAGSTTSVLSIRNATSTITQLGVNEASLAGWVSSATTGRYVAADSSAAQLGYSPSGTRLRVQSLASVFIDANNITRFKVNDTGNEAFHVLAMNDWELRLRAKNDNSHRINYDGGSDGVLVVGNQGVLLTCVQHGRQVQINPGSAKLTYSPTGHRISVESGGTHIIGSNNAVIVKVTASTCEHFTPVGMFDWPLRFRGATDDTHLIRYNSGINGIEMKSFGEQWLHSTGSNVSINLKGGGGFVDIMDDQRGAWRSVSAASFIVQSDRRDKSDIVSLDDAACAESVLSTRARRFVRQAKQEHGFVAQEVPASARIERKAEKSAIEDGPANRDLIGYDLAAMTAENWGATRHALTQLKALVNRVTAMEAK